MVVYCIWARLALRLPWKRERIALPQTRCNYHVFTVLGAGNNWGGLPFGQIPSFSKTNRFHKGPHRIYIHFFVLKTCAVRTLEHYGESKKIAVFSPFLECGLWWCAAQLNCTLRSLLPAARSALSGKKSQEWIKHWRTVSHHKTRQWSQTNLGLGVANYKSASNNPGDIRFRCYVYRYYAIPFSDRKIWCNVRPPMMNSTRHLKTLPNWSNWWGLRVVA